MTAALTAAKPCYAALDARSEEEIPRFVKMSVASMTPGYIEHMLSVNVADVPVKYREAFKAKRLELYTMRQLGEGQKKGAIRLPDQDCAIPKEAKSGEIGVLLIARYEEITLNEVLYLTRNTHCSERQMMCEFSLQIVHEHIPGQKRPRTRYFLHPKDPLMALVTEYRHKGGNHDTLFFGRSPYPQCD